MSMELCSVSCLSCSRRFSLAEGGGLPLKLSCGCCSVCVSCMNRDHKRRKTSVACPKCDKLTHLDRSKVQEQLPPDFFILGLLTAELKGLIRFPKKVSTEKKRLKTFLEEAANNNDSDIAEEYTPNVFCSDCSKSATLHCGKCGGVYCDRCFERVHCSSNSLRTHTSTPLTLALATPSECSSHPGNVHTHYCSTDSTAVCPDCLLENHRDHKIIKLHEAAANVRETLSKRLAESSAVLENMKRTEKTLESKLLSVCEQMESIVEKVDMCFSLLHSALQSQETVILRELNHAVSLYGNSLVASKAVVHSHLKSLSAKLSEGKNALKSDYLTVKNGPEIIAKLSDLNLIPQSLGEDKSEPISFTMSPIKGVMESGCLVYDSEYQGPALLSQDGPVHPKYRDVAVLGKPILFDDIGVSPSVSPVSTSPSVSAKSSRSGTPADAQGQKSNTKAQVSTSVSASTPRATPGRGRGSRFQTPVKNSSTPVGRRSVTPVKHSTTQQCVNSASQPASLVHLVGQSAQKSTSLVMHSSNQPPIVDTQGAWDAKITHVESLDKFFVQTVEQQGKLTDITTELEKYCPSSQPLTANDIYIGLLCGILSPQDGVWLRAVVERYLGNNLISVKFVDYGRPEKVDLSRVRPLPPSLFSCPALCSECALANVSPKNRSYQGHVSWSKEANQKFQTMANMNKIKLKVVDWSDSGVLLTDVLYSIENGYTKVSAMLVSLGLAVRGAQRPKEDGISPHVTLGCRDTRDVVVPVAENPHDFFVHLDYQAHDVDNLIDEIQRIVSRGQHLPIGTPRKGVLCLAKYVTDNKWYRSMIVDVSKERVRVLFLDFGNDHVVPVVYPLPPQLRTTPVQAIHCSLHNALPVGSRDKWSEEVADFFNDYVSGRVFSMTVQSIGCENNESKGGSFMNPLSVDMVEKGGEQSLSDVLVTLGMARYKVPPQKDVTKLISEILRSSNFGKSRLLDTPPPGMCQSPQPQGKAYDTLMPSGQEAAPLVIPRAVIPPKESEVPCSITSVTDCHSFSIAFKENEHQYAEILQELALIPQPGQPAPTLSCGSACLALFNSTWHRAVVIEPPLKKSVTVCYVDYGNISQVKVSDVRSISSMLCQYPARAVRCKLDGVELPLSSRASSLFLRLVSSPSGLLAKIHSSADEVLSISLIHPERGDVKEAILKEDSLGSAKYDLSNDSILPQGPFILQVTVISDNVVYGHVEENAHTIRKVALDVEAECETANPISCASCLSVNESCCAQYSQDGSWNRAFVRHVDLDREKIEVLFIDFGNTELVDASMVVKRVVHPEISALALPLKVRANEKVEVNGRYKVHLFQKNSSNPPLVSMQPLL